MTAVAFAPTIHNGFTNWDDPPYVTENEAIRSLSLPHLKTLATAVVEGNYHPLTMLSLAVDYHFWRLNPKGYHITNLALHLLSTAAAFLLTLLLTSSTAMSVVASLFFGIHPAHVESVAWASARKDLLYVMFYLWACVCYARWVREKRANPAYAGGVLGLFVLSLLSKGMAVTLPIALLLIDLYLGGIRDLRKRVVEKIPLVLVSVGFGILAIFAQKSGGAIQTRPLFPLPGRMLIAVHSTLAYLVTAFAPVKLAAFYPYPPKIGGSLPASYYGAPIVALLVAAIVWRTWRRTRSVGFGALFFVLNLVLVLQILPLGSAMMADRYTYLSYVGIGFALAEGYRLGTAGTRRGAISIAVTVGFLLLGAAFFMATRARCEVWSNDLTLWSDVIQKYPQAAQAYISRARAFEDRGDYARGIADLDRALSLNDRNALALCNRGILLLDQGESQRALADLDRSVRLDPSNAVAWNSRGTAHARLDDYAAAAEDFTKAIELRKSFSVAYRNRANARYLLEQLDGALRDYDAAIASDPGAPESYYGRGLARVRLGDPEGALEDYASALRIHPAYAAVYTARSQALHALGRDEEALRDGMKARELGEPIDAAYLDRLRRAPR